MSIVCSQYSHSNSNDQNYISEAEISLYNPRASAEYETAVYVTSKRGTKLVFYEGNTYTPNEKSHPGQISRNWKCSLYYRRKCKARVITREVNNRDVIRSAVIEHTHPKMYPYQNFYPHSTSLKRS